MLTTERLSLRLPIPDDVAVLHELNRVNWQRIGNRLRTPEETQAQLADEVARRPFGSPGWHQFVVERREGGGVIGRVAINFGGPGERQAELGYGFHPDSWGQGYGAEALARTLTHLFVEHGLHRIVAITGIHNQPSRRLLERLGFRLEGETLESFFHEAEQRFVDEAVYAILAREWPRH
jgi:RimJ/RimL family protein N-acetyltransferase